MHKAYILRSVKTNSALPNTSGPKNRQIESIISIDKHQVISEDLSKDLSSFYGYYQCVNWPNLWSSSL